MAVTVSNERGDPVRRVIVVGASNVARSISTLVAAAQLVWQGPIEAIIAGGHGRSYGRATSVLGRALPGIGQAGLWKALETRPSYGTSAVLTDVGNDLLYGSEPELVAQWVDVCIARLTDAADTTLVCGMPLVNITSLSPRRFLAYRALFFPRCRLTLSEIAARATDLQARLQRSAVERGATWLEPAAAWYGRDPIHWRPAVCAELWTKIFFGGDDQVSLRLRRNALRGLYLRSLVPYERRLWGVMQRRAQPSGMLRDGTTIALY
jgi:hypothetical protein